MAVYDINGNSINTTYGIDGDTLANVYDVNGNPLTGEYLTVMSYNVMRWESINSRKAVQDVAFVTDNADIVGIQEWGYTASGGSVGGVAVLTYLPACGYDYIEVGTSIYNKNALVSKYPLSSVTETVFPNESSVSYQRCVFTYKGTNIAWYNAHLVSSSQEAEKVAEAKILFDAVSNEDYFILTGDFNTGGGWDTSAPEYTTIMKQFVDAGFNCANFTNQHGWHKTWYNGSSAESSGAATDHIITSANIEMLEVKTDLTKISVAAETGQDIDHVPLIAYLRVK